MKISITAQHDSKLFGLELSQRVANDAGSRDSPKGLAEPTGDTYANMAIENELLLYMC